MAAPAPVAFEVTRRRIGRGPSVYSPRDSGSVPGAGTTLDRRRPPGRAAFASRAPRGRTRQLYRAVARGLVRRRGRRILRAGEPVAFPASRPSRAARAPPPGRPVGRRRGELAGRARRPPRRDGRRRTATVL